MMWLASLSFVWRSYGNFKFMFFVFNTIFLFWRIQFFTVETHFHLCSVSKATWWSRRVAFVPLLCLTWWSFRRAVTCFFHLAEHILQPDLHPWILPNCEASLHWLLLPPAKGWLLEMLVERTFGHWDVSSEDRLSSGFRKLGLLAQYCMLSWIQSR